MSAADLPGAQIRIRCNGDGTFSADPEGALAYVLNVETWQRETIDLVAWMTTDENRWWRHSKVGVLLGEHNLYHADWHDEPVMLWRTPVEWLRAELAKPGNHCCIVDWSCDPLFVLGRAPEVQCVGEAVRSRLAKRVAECRPRSFKLSVTHDVG